MSFEESYEIKTGRAVILYNEIFYTKKLIPIVHELRKKEEDEDKLAEYLKLIEDETMDVKLSTEADVNCTTELLKEMHFGVAKYKDLTIEQMEDVFTKEAANEELANIDCFLCIVSTHGNNEKDVGDVFLGTDLGTLGVKEHLLEKFSAENCPALAGKPKIFFLAASRGALDASKINTMLKHEGDVKEQMEESLRLFANIFKPEDLDLEDDFLIVHGSEEGYVDLAEESGGYFLQAVCEAFKDNYKDQEIIEMLNAMVKTVNASGKQKAQYTTKLTKNLYLKGLHELDEHAKDKEPLEIIDAE